MQVDDGLTHMLDEVFGSLIKDLLTLITELPTLTVSPCDTLFCLFTHAHTPHIQFLTAKKNKKRILRRVRSFPNYPTVDGAV